MQTAALLWPLVTQPGSATSSNMNEALGAFQEHYWQDDAVRWKPGVCCSPGLKGRVRGGGVPPSPAWDGAVGCPESPSAPAHVYWAIQLQAWTVDAVVYVSVREQTCGTLNLRSFVRPLEEQSGQERKVLYGVFSSVIWLFSFLVNLGKCSHHGKLIIATASIIKSFW